MDNIQDQDRRVGMSGSECLAPFMNDMKYEVVREQDDVARDGGGLPVPRKLWDALVSAACTSLLSAQSKRLTELMCFPDSRNCGM
jgi:hypothetical protein